MPLCGEQGGGTEDITVERLSRESERPIVARKRANARGAKGSGSELLRRGAAHATIVNEWILAEVPLCPTKKLA